MERGKRWTITINNYTEEDLTRLQSLYPTMLSYLVMGREVGAQGTPHIQGYFETVKKMTLGALKKKVHKTAHFEKAAGDAKSNLQYCSKEDRDPIIKGEPMHQGNRTDLEELKAMIDNGCTERELAERDFKTWLRNWKALAHYRHLLIEPRSWKTEITVLIGPTGCGKTRWAFEMAMEKKLRLWTYPGKGWFDGYAGEEVALFDDFYGQDSDISWDILLRLMDRYPMQVPIKGSFVEWCPRHMVITSNKHPDTWYFQPDTSAFWRRIDFFIDEDFWQ